MNKDKSPTYIIDVHDDMIVVANTSLSRFWKVKDTKLLSIFSTIQRGKPELHIQPSVAKLFHHNNYPSCGSQDAAIIGVPYNRGSALADSKVSGLPDALRQASVRYPVYSQIHDTTTSGLYDLNDNRFLFQNLTFKDLGNMDEPSTESLITLIASIEQITKMLVEQDTCLCAIGGDHSITYAFVQCLAKETKHSVILIDLDAHHDCKTGLEDNEEIHHANFISYLLNMECIAGIIQIGVRGIRSPGQMLFHQKLIQIPASSANPKVVRAAIRGLLRHASNPIGYLSIDADVLDPSDFPLVDFPVTGGLTANQVINVISEVFHSELCVRGIDLVEGLPEGNIQKNDYDVLLYILAHCLDGIDLQRHKSWRKRFPWSFLT